MNYSGRIIDELFDNIIRFSVNDFNLSLLYNDNSLTNIIIDNCDTKIHLQTGESQDKFKYVPDDVMHDSYSQMKYYSIIGMNIQMFVDTTLDMNNDYVYIGPADYYIPQMYSEYIALLKVPKQLMSYVWHAVVAEVYDTLYNNNRNNGNNGNTNSNNNNGNNNTSLDTVNRPVNATTRCFDPINYNDVNIGVENATFHVLNTDGKLSFSSCLDNSALKRYKKDKDYLFFKCKETTPVSSVYITSNSVYSEKYRMLGFQQRIYVKDSEIKKVKIGKEYVLEPIEAIGRLASYNVIMGGDIVSALHCGPADGSMLYSIKEVRSISGGNKLKKIQSKKRKIRQHYNKNKTHKRYKKYSTK